jgi:hypothetical protein
MASDFHLTLQPIPKRGADQLGSFCRSSRVGQGGGFFGQVISGHFA